MEQRGNALDVASLGVALMRASGIPAKYVSGSLSYSQAQTLIRTMFPPSYQTVGYIPSGTSTADPADDYQLITETEDHYWLQFNTGSGFQDADPLMPGATIGETFTTSTGTFGAIAQKLEETTEVQLVVEIYSQASALFGGDGLSDTTVLDQTFNDDQLVGRPLSIGNFVSTTSAGFIFTATTNTYQPYINLGDDAYASGSHDHVINGTPYQEILTNFPLGSQVLTGLFLNITLSGPQGSPETYQHTILDRIGYAAQQGLVAPERLGQSIGGSASQRLRYHNGQRSGWASDPNSRLPLYHDLSSQQAQSVALGKSSNGAPAIPLASGIATNFAIDYTRYLDENVLYNSDVLTGELAPSYGVVAYWDRPRVIVASQTVTLSADLQSATVTQAIDLLRDKIRVEASPRQASNASFNFNVFRGFSENAAENAVAAQANPSGAATSTGQIFAAAQQQGIPLVLLTSTDIAQLSSYQLDPTATARITAALQASEVILVPASLVTVGGEETSAWFEIDPTTGYTTGVMEDGSHQGIEEEEVDSEFETLLAAGVFASGAFMVGLVYGASLQYLPHAEAQEIKNNINHWVGYPAGIGAIGGFFFKTPAVGIVAAIIGDFVLGVDIGADLVHVDPSLPPELSDLTIPLPTSSNSSGQAISSASTAPAGAVSGKLKSSSLAVSDAQSASWTSTALSSFLVTSLSASAGAVTDSTGKAVGAGSVAMVFAATIPFAVTGNNDYNVTGSGNLSFYASAANSLGVSGDWQNYTAIVTGNVSMTLTVPDGALVVGGRSLPAGTYTIMTGSATLSGSGHTSSPTFSGSVSITATSGTINLGPGSGNLSVGGRPLGRATPQHSTATPGRSPSRPTATAPIPSRSMATREVSSRS